MCSPATQSEPVPTRASAPVTAPPRFPAWLMAVLLALVTMAVYWPATGHDFVKYDDPVYVTDNSRVQAGLTWENIRWASTTLHFGLWHPLTWASHMLDCQWFGLRPGWHHLTSLLLHAANTALLFVVLRRMTGALWRSALVAALFALHPLHVESVAWVAERKDVLSTLFVLLTLWAYARYAEVESLKSKVQSPETEDQSPKSEVQRPKSNPPSPGCGAASVQSQEAGSSITQHATRNTDHASRITLHAPRFYVLALIFFVCGLMSKPMVVTLPLVLLVLDYWPLRRFDRAAVVSRPSLAARLLLEKLPFVLAALLACWVTLRAANQHGWLSSAAQCPLTVRMANATVSYARYFLQVFWPVNLAVYYPFPATFSVGSLAGAALLLLGISVAAFCLARRWPYVVVGWLWYLITLLPVIGLMVQLATYSHADRYTYVPLIGLFVSLVWGGWELVSHWRRPALACAVAAVAAAIVLCMVLTRQQLQHWQNSETLFRHALEVTEDNYIVRTGLGTVLAEKGQTDEAIRQYREAIRLKPDFALARNNLGNALEQKGQIDEAIRQYQEALHLKPDDPLAHNNLGNALEKKGRIDEAISQYREALRLKSDDPLAHNNLGNALGKKGQIDEAISQYQEALRLKPADAGAHYNLGNALATKGQLDEAIRQFQEALRLKPDYAEAHNNLGNALAEEGRTDEATRQFQEALRLKPADAEAHYNLGTALDKEGQTDEAIRQFQQALRLSPDYAEARYNFGSALATKGQLGEAISQYQEALRLKPGFFQPYLALAQNLPRVGRLKDAAFQMEEFLRTCPRANLEAPNSPVREAALAALNDLAWLLATRPQADERDGARAVRFAERACELTQYQRTILVGTLAAAYAEAGRFAEAVTTAERASALATQAGDQALLTKNRQLLELYRAGRAYHEAAAPVPSLPASSHP